jgi:hypothetical protein
MPVSIRPNLQIADPATQSAQPTSAPDDDATPITIVGEVSVASDPPEGIAGLDLSTGELLTFTAALIAAWISWRLGGKAEKTATALETLKSQLESEGEKLKVFLPERVQAVNQLAKAMSPAWDAVTPLQLGAWDSQAAQTAFAALRDADSHGAMWFPPDLSQRSANFLQAFGELCRIAGQCATDACRSGMWNHPARVRFDDRYRELASAIQTVVQDLEGGSAST